MKWVRGFSLFLAFYLISGICAPFVFAEGGEPFQDSGSPKSTPSQVVLTHFDKPERTDATAFTLGTPLDKVADWFADYVGGFTGYDAQGNSYDLITGTWSLENVDTGTTGVYYASAAPDLGNDYILEDGVTPPRQLCAVSVQTSGNPDINCCVSGRGFLRFPWVLTSKQQDKLEQFTVRLRKDGGTWAPLSEGFFFTSGDLQLSQRIFQQNCSYNLQVFYPGGQTGILSFQYDDELLITDYSEGDRDGGDVNGDDLSSGTQPAPTPNRSHDHNDDDMSTQDYSETESAPESSSAPSEASSEPIPTVPTVLAAPEQTTSSPKTKSGDAKPTTKKENTLQSQASSNLLKHSQTDADTQTKKSSVQNTASTVQESYSPTQTVISGLRLRDLCADENNIVFGAGDLTVSLPSKQLLALNLEDMDTLSVKLMQPKKNQITLAVETSGKTVTALPGTILRLRYTPQSENAEITIRNEAEKKAVDAEFDGKFLRFSVETAGTYTILETAAVQKKSKAVPGSTSLPPLLMGGGALLAAGSTVLVRRNRHG